MLTRVSSYSSPSLTELAHATCLEQPTVSLEKRPVISSHLSEFPVANSTKQRWKSRLEQHFRGVQKPHKHLGSQKLKVKIIELLSPNSVNSVTYLIPVNAI